MMDDEEYDRWSEAIREAYRRATDPDVFREAQQRVVDQVQATCARNGHVGAGLCPVCGYSSEKSND